MRGPAIRSVPNQLLTGTGNGDRSIPPMNDRPAKRARVWGEFTIANGSSGRWRIGPMVLSVSRREREWRVCRASGDPLALSCELEVPADVGDPPAGSNVTRYATASQSDALVLTPVLPD